MVPQAVRSELLSSSIDAAEQQHDVEEEVILSHEGPPDFDEGFAGVEGEGAEGEVGQILVGVG